MKILVLAKLYKGELNNFDQSALEVALRREKDEVYCLSMGPISFVGPLKKLTRLGVKPILVSDPNFALSDTIATSTILAKAISLISPDVIFAGRNSFDGDTGQVPYMLSYLTSFSIIPNVIKVNEDILLTREKIEVNINKNHIYTFENLFPLRSPSIFSSEKDVEILSNNDLNLPLSAVGESGSPTKVISSFKNDSYRRFPKFIEFNNLEDVIKKELDKEDIVNQEEVNKADEIYYAGDIADVAKKYGKIIKKLDVENKSIEEINKLIDTIQPNIILWEETQKYKELASKVAISRGIGLTADCVNFSFLNNEFHMFRPALGGDVIAEIVSKSPIAMASVKKESKDEEIVVDIGVGALSNLDNIVKFASSIGAKVVCSRPVVNKDVFAYDYQVGLTGKMISPKVLITFGVDGAIQHIVGISGANTIISVNNNKKAPIFDYSDFGIVMDINSIKM